MDILAYTLETSTSDINMAATKVISDHRLADPEPLAAMLRACEAGN